jgi:tyrosine-protein phosphatase YwqE
MTEVVEIRKEDLAKLLELINYDLELLEDVPVLVDEERDAEISKNIGKLLEINYDSMNKLKKRYSFIRDYQGPDSELEKLEQEFL